ncbi:Ras family protein [Aphelenchoides avenae]|nr:Ras family protein [Aphelenchus avenae]
MSYNYLFKIVVVGDHNCGKSCILLRFAENTFRQDHISTLGVDFKLKTIKLGRDKVRLELWDTAGMERYRTIYNSYYHSAHGIMCVYDLTNEKSFENLENYWLKEIRNHAPQNAVILLVGNKADMEAERKVSFDRAERLAKRIGVSLYEVSAKTGINVDEAFQDLATAMRDRLLVSNMNSDSDDSDQLSSAFHVDGVISADDKLIGGSGFPTFRCCSSAPSPTFV